MMMFKMINYAFLTPSIQKLKLYVAGIRRPLEVEHRSIWVSY